MIDQPLHNAIPVLQSRWKALLSEREKCLEEDDLDAVHDLRVSTRRFRAALDLFAPLCQGLYRVEDSIRRLTREVGRLRNLDEALNFFEKQEWQAGRGSFKRVLQRLNSDRRQESARLHRLLNNLDIANVELRLKGVADLFLQPEACKSAEGNVISLPGFLSVSGVALFERLYRLWPPPVQSEDAAGRHALRIAVKRWRYFLEIMAEISQQDYSLLLELLKEYQSLLGDLNDLEVFRELADEIGITHSAGEELQALIAGKRELYLVQLAELVRLKPIRYEFFI